MRKVETGKEKRKEKRKEKIMTFIVATKFIASRPAERRSTGTPHTRAKNSNVLGGYSLSTILNPSN